MNNVMLIILMVFVLLLVGTVANSLGVTSTVFHGACTTVEQRQIDPDCFQVSEPNPAIPDWLDSIIGMGKWVLNGMGAVLQIVTFQVDIPPLVNLLFFTPISIGVMYIVVRVVRGGG